MDVKGNIVKEINLNFFLTKVWVASFAKKEYIQDLISFKKINNMPY